MSGSCRSGTPREHFHSYRFYYFTHPVGDEGPHACVNATCWPDRCILVHRSCVWWAASRGMGLSPAATCSLSLYSHIFSSVESSISLLLHCMSEYLNFGTREAERLFWPADVFYVLHRLAGLTHFTSSLQFEVTCGGELLSVSASGKAPLQYCSLTNFGHNRLIFLWFIQLCQALI